MIFKNFIELNSTVANGFIVNDILSVLEQDSSIIGEDEEQILQNAINFVYLIQNGFIFLSEEKPIEDLENSLDAFNLAYNALKGVESTSKLNDIQQIISSSLKELEKIVELKEINIQEMKDSFILFNSMRDLLLKRAQNLSSISEYPPEI